MFVPNEAAVAAGFIPLYADEVLAGDLLWVTPTRAVLVDPVEVGGVIQMAGNTYDLEARVYVKMRGSS